jgi:hypothetical protein
LVDLFAENYTKSARQTKVQDVDESMFAAQFKIGKNFFVSVLTGRWGMGTFFAGTSS